MTQSSRQKLIDILDYWHTIEFFVPFDLDQVTDVEDKSRLRFIRPEQLASLPPDYFARFEAPPTMRVTGFQLYLGLFDRAEIATVCKRALPALSAAEADEDEQRGLGEGRTCFARVALGAGGEPMFDPLSVSTVPWALGRMASHGTDGLTLDAFNLSLCELKDRLADFDAERAFGAPLSGIDMARLCALFADWAGFSPAAAQPLLLEVRIGPKPKEKPGSDEAIGEVTEDASDDDDAVADEPVIDILNSFYIEDLERAMRSLREDEVPMLAAYLEPLAHDRRIDVYTPEGRAALLRQLHPALANRGHWLSQPAHSMSLMQQFAINTGLEALLDGGLFAVNGPPGTGKTTLLRELFAENIVRRAAVLSRCEVAKDAFLPRKTQVHFRNGDSTWIACLKPELTGFEMVVASSNNAAVENISSDLPKLKSLGEDWRHVEYLRSVAYRLAAEDKKGYFHPSPEIAPWGLISCALGNSANRRHFVSKFYDKNWNEKVQPDPRCQNIHQWLAAYKGPSFRQAASAFRELEARVEGEVARLAQCADLWREQLGVDRGQFCADAEAALASATSGAARAAADEAETGRRLQALLERQAHLREEERLLDRQSPVFWSRWLQLPAAQLHRRECAANAAAQREVLAQVSAARAEQAACADAATRAAGAVQAARDAVSERLRIWEERKHRLASMQERYGFELPACAEELECDGFQIKGLWHDPAVAGLRSALFAAALALHEAWLAEVGRKDGGFGGNLFAIPRLLTNIRPDDDANVALIWQSLFMVVPVVSTTFASLARQFRGMGAGSIGWLFIDEAGQAVPQAAVGGLWRARRAVVVGDPRQIEPVFTVPLALIRALSKRSPHTAGEAYAPDKVSVQRLADDANRHGTLAPEEGGPGLWIGSPLRVHRRCADPMFKLANLIAYGSKMVIEEPRRTPAPLEIPMGESAWIDIGGPAAFKQVVPAQIEFVAGLIVELYRRSGTLPALYVISPFKAVRDAVRKRLQEVDWPDKPPKPAALKKWCKTSVGTVHTFQGKEQAVVVMVLGVDPEHAGSAQWAASKANLLNVALTRAQQYFYMVGAADVWREKAFFGAVCGELPMVGAADFMAGVGAVAIPHAPQATAPLRSSAPAPGSCHP
ncbi:AAA domain-containing protein [Oxalobacteraceae bacterium OTU3CINTB1]|nr:AAA domain-containing protein [Oxalobacteraceae bacterium OTU3CINTB1]